MRGIDGIIGGEAYEKDCVETETQTGRTLTFRHMAGEVKHAE